MGKEDAMEAQGSGSSYRPFERSEEEDDEGAASLGGEEQLQEHDTTQDRVDYEQLLGDENLSAMDRQYAAPTNIPRRIHIVGTGSIGKLVAHSLRGLPDPPPVTLLFHRPQLLDAWEKGNKQITIHDDGFDVPRGGFDVELAPNERMQHGVLLQDGTPDVYDVADENLRPHEAIKLLEEEQKQAAAQQMPEPAESDEQKNRLPANALRYSEYHSRETIHNLIVTTKAAYTVPALARLKPRILPTSTICFLQNGMGTIDELNQKLFPDPKDRPNYAQGIITHGANVPPERAEQDPFYAVHAGHGTIALGLLPRDDIPRGTDIDPTTASRSQTWKWSQSSRHLLRTITRSPVLCAVGFTPTELLQQQLEKLAVNSVLNPLTALLDARNGSLLYNFALTRTTRLLLAETSQIIRNLPELRGVPNVNTRFSPERLETLVVSVANKTKDNVSSMLADVRAGRETEIEYINGYIVRRGEEQGIKAVVNYGIMQTVIGKARMVSKETRGDVPENEEGVQLLHVIALKTMGRCVDSDDTADPI
ncbi:2-dehydropantoate 2-reductase (Ketopantoate reductase) (KPA reductase) (KPR) [Saxophila tyrrhenica]|uniref:2-dehydropantoate 2-reductase n=1 Tax=Saxophila tyrrhenica TaxID=1690608 RepID=A0AAV9NXQ0_9PEZI|nr:2-dehydropantoate 2-reductase (Ketopantoate reductase) (KPA reductase) (KPR) [Saxophila tyrrhenica]